MDTPSLQITEPATGAEEVARQWVLACVQAHLRGEETEPLYLVTGPTHTATAILEAAATALRTAGHDRRLLAGTGADFVRLWHDTLRRGLTPFVRRALAARSALLLAGVEALREEPFAQGELTRLITPGRLILLAGQEHLGHLTVWGPRLSARLVTASATSLCLHEGPCFSDVDAWTIVDLVAEYYGLTRAALLSRRRTGPVVLARQMAMVLLREQGLTCSMVGHILRRDHSTVTYGHARLQQLSACEPHIRDDLAWLRRRAHIAQRELT